MMLERKAAPEPDTIAAVASPPGRGGIGVLRVSGPGVPAIIESVVGTSLPARRACLRTFRDASEGSIDRGLALFFPAPASFTGEHVLELQGHGSPVVLDCLLTRLLELGARIARPGEFSERAFLNGRIDLSQAEAIADLIDASTREAAAAASRSLEGAFSREINQLSAAIVALRVYVEAAIDFPEEEMDFLTEGRVAARLHTLQRQILDLRVRAQRGAVLREGLRLAIVGAPNVGKSSLLNALSRRESAIVTNIPGTTRDVLREVIDLGGLPVHLADTAGLRETSDPVERAGVERARAEIDRADRVLLVVDDRVGATQSDWERLSPANKRPPVTVLYNKCDLSGRSAGAVADGVRLSAATGVGLPALVTALQQTVGLADGATEFTARRRHLDALDRVAAALEAGRVQLSNAAAGELLAEDLRSAHNALGTITGTFTSDDLLGEIFSSFCIGK